MMLARDEGPPAVEPHFDSFIRLFAGSALLLDIRFPGEVRGVGAILEELSRSGKNDVDVGTHVPRHTAEALIACPQRNGLVAPAAVGHAQDILLTDGSPHPVPPAAAYDGHVVFDQVGLPQEEVHEGTTEGME